MGEIDISIKSPNGNQIKRISIDPRFKIAQLMKKVAD